MRVATIFFATTSLFVLASCRRAGDESGKEALKKDTALASDLRDLSADTSAYAAAADVAMASVPDTTLDRPAGPVRMRTVATTTGTPPVPAPASTRPASRAPVSTIPASSAAPAASPTTVARVSTTSASALPACDSPATADQRRCLMSYLARSDVGLDHTYQSLIAEMKRRAGANAGGREPDDVKRLREAQRAWLVYRDTECRRRNRGKEGPLWAPVRAQCLGEFSGQRQDELAGSLAKLTAG